jgi:hypothetical protein
MNFDGIISLLIACIELVYIINLLVIAEKNTINRYGIGIIALLFGYQFIEFLICNLGLQKQIFIYLAFLDITLLPPLCLFTVLKFSARESQYSKLVFIPALFFIVYYPFVLNQFAVTKCTVLYVSYHYPLGELYGIFYYLPIIFSIIILNKKWGAETDQLQKSLTRTFLFGFLFTFIPSMILAIAIPAFLTAVESLLCKLAFVFASFLFYFALKNKHNSERK